MATTNDTTYNLTTLLSSTSFALAYSLPLLFLSLLITFSGTFFTLDRTRQFAPKQDATLPGAFDAPKKTLKWRLEGGIGGLAIGYTFGGAFTVYIHSDQRTNMAKTVHLSTLLSLMIPALSSANNLAPKAFIPVWLLSSLLTTFLAARWKYCALAFAGISGGYVYLI